MNDDVKVGLGVVALLALCCGGPLIVSLLASGAVLGALGAVWTGGRPLLLAAGAVLIGAAVWRLARRRASHGDTSAACCTTPRPSVRAAESDRAESGRSSAPDQLPVASAGQRTSR